MSKSKTLYVFVLTVFLASCSRAEGPKAKAPDCDISAGPCVKQMEDLTVTFEIFPRPVRPMQNVSIAVLLEHAGQAVDDADVTIDLTMPGMYMGKNFFNLTHIGKGVYRAEGVLPRCPKGGKLWRSEVMVRRNGEETVSVSYLFEVD